jgi:hypothetical protein
MMIERDYASFSKLAGRLMRPVAAALDFTRVTDTIYVREHGAVVHAIFLQTTRTGGDAFWVDYGVMVPTLGVPWWPVSALKDCGLLVNKTLFHPGKGQGYDCSTKAALEDSIKKIHADLVAFAVPWFESLLRLEDVAAAYYDRWSLTALGGNIQLKRSGVMHYGLLLVLLGDKAGARAWMLEAQRLMDHEIDEEDLECIRKVLHDLGDA